MDLRKPPIVEVWVEFQCDPGPSQQDWDLDVASAFLSQFSDLFTHTEVLKEQEFRIAAMPTGDPRVDLGQLKLSRARTRSADGTRFLQLGKDMFVYNIVKKGSSYPGFDSLCREAWEKFDAYIRHFRPRAVRRLRLHYLDRLEIPCSAGEPVDLDRFLKVGVRCPEKPFGALGRFAVQLAFQCESQDDQLSLTVTSEPRAPDDTVSRVRMDWEATSANMNSLEKEDIMVRLKRAHARIQDCFGASFTKEAWQLFEPST